MGPTTWLDATISRYVVPSLLKRLSICEFIPAAVSLTAAILRREMARVSINVIGILNLVSLLVSLPVLGAGIWLAARGGSDCERFLERPAMAAGIFLIVLSLAGLIGSCCRVQWLLWLYLLVMFVLIVLVFCFTVFAFVVTNKGAGEVVSGRGYREYRLGDYSHWLQRRVNNSENWSKIRSCLHDSNVCGSMHRGNQTIDQFVRRHLSPIQVRLLFL